MNPLWSAGEPSGRIEAVSPETPDAATLVIRPGACWVRHRAIDLRLTNPGPRCLVVDAEFAGHMSDRTVTATRQLNRPLPKLRRILRRT